MEGCLVEPFGIDNRSRQVLDMPCKLIRDSLFGSHRGKSRGIVIDRCPEGLLPCFAYRSSSFRGGS